MASSRCGCQSPMVGRGCGAQGLSVRPACRLLFIWHVASLASAERPDDFVLPRDSAKATELENASFPSPLEITLQDQPSNVTAVKGDQDSTSFLEGITFTEVGELHANGLRQSTVQLLPPGYSDSDAGEQPLGIVSPLGIASSASNAGGSGGGNSDSSNSVSGNSDSSNSVGGNSDGGNPDAISDEGGSSIGGNTDHHEDQGPSGDDSVEEVGLHDSLKFYHRTHARLNRVTQNDVDDMNSQGKSMDASRDSAIDAAVKYTQTLHSLGQEMVDYGTHIPRMLHRVVGRQTREDLEKVRMAILGSEADSPGDRGDEEQTASLQNVSEGNEEHTASLDGGGSEKIEGSESSGDQENTQSLNKDQDGGGSDTIEGSESSGEQEAASLDKDQDGGGSDKIEGSESSGEQEAASLDKDQDGGGREENSPSSKQAEEGEGTES